MSEKKPVLVICRASAGQMYLGVLLNRIWYSPILAKTPEEGILLAQQHPFSLLLLDGDLPGNDLQSAVSLLRTNPLVKDQPLVVFITRENPVSNEALIAQGCSAVLTKPLDLSFVYGVLARLSGQPRNTPRIPIRMRVEIEEERPEKTLTCVNISEGGLYLRTSEPLPEKDILHLKFILPHSTEQLEATAEVVRTAPLGTQIEGEPGMGLQFLNIPESIRQQIRNFVQWEMIGDLEWEATI